MASVRQRLANIARTNGVDFNLLLTHFAIERFLYRLCKSDFKNQFILKGAMLFRIWSYYSYKFLMSLVVSISNQIKMNQNWVQLGIWKVNQA